MTDYGTRNGHSDVLRKALAYCDAGLSVLPVARDGSKAPDWTRLPRVGGHATWDPLKEELQSREDVERMFRGERPPGIGVIGGAVSGGLECVDFDREAESIFPAWCELVEAEAPGLVARLSVARTPKPGFHVRYRCPDVEVPGNTKLAVDPDAPRNDRTLIETRGEGGYALAPGCPADCHETGRPYEHHSGPALENVQAVGVEEREVLIRCARSFDRSPREGAPAGGGHRGEEGLSPGDDYNRRGPDFMEVLGKHGWEVARHRGTVRYVRRPGKKAGWSGTLGVCRSSKSGDLFAVFSSNADPFEGATSGRDCTCYSKFAVYALLEHEGDFSAAAKALYADGYGERRAKESRKAEAGRRPAAEGEGESNRRDRKRRRQEESPADQAPRPEVLLTTDEYAVNTQAIQALSDPRAAPEVYQRGNALVTVLRPARAPGKAAVDRPEGTPRISPLAPPQLREILARVVRFQKVVCDKKGKAKVVHAHPADWCVGGVYSRGCWPGVRPLEAVVEAPTLRPDGSVLDAPGWDGESGLLYEPAGTYPPVPRTPSRADAARAVDAFFDLVQDFPFAGDADRAVWLAAALTALARQAVSGPCPLFLFDGNAPGAGKTLLVDAIAITATGREISRTAFPENDEELRKRITSVALAGDRLVLFDNVACAFGGSSLDTALTGTVWQDRLLGRSEMTPELPLFTCWFATGNNVALKGDARRRAVLCRLVTHQERPEERTGFKYPDLLDHVLRHRGELVVAGLTLLRAYVAAGRPAQKLSAFGSYEAWSDLIRSAVFWATGGLDPCATREKLRAADPALATLTSLLAGWAELPGAQVTGVTVAEALRFLNDPNHAGEFQTLRAALLDWTKTDKLPGAGVIGVKLRGCRDRVVNGLALKAESVAGGVQRWRVAQVAEEGA
jgi:hypothetical protein